MGQSSAWWKGYKLNQINTRMRLHHIGYVVKDISEYEKKLIYKEKRASVEDPIQKAALSLYETYSEVLIELIQPLEESSFTYAFLQKQGNAYHHLCYEVDSIEAMRRIAEKHGLLLFKGPLPAPLFDGKEVYFYFDKNKSITEFLINK